MDLKQLKRILIISRPMFWPLYPVLFLIGLNAAGGTMSSAAWMEIIALSFPAALLTYGVNDAYDTKADEKNPRKKNIVEGTAIPPGDADSIKKVAPFAIFVLVLSSLATNNAQNAAIMLVFSLSAYFYSATPIRLKERPPFDSLVNGFFYFLAPFALGYSFGAPVTTMDMRYVLLLGGCAIGLHALAAITDYEPDRKVRNNTVAVWLGQRGAALFALVFFAINLFFAWPVTIYLMVVAFAVGALANLINPGNSKRVMAITIMWGIVTTLTYFVEKILVNAG